MTGYTGNFSISGGTVSSVKLSPTGAFGGEAVTVAASSPASGISVPPGWQVQVVSTVTPTGATFQPSTGLR
jgi:hypothetical protein